MSNQFGGSRDAGRYERMEVLGSGAYGRVYKALDTENNRYIAMKKMNINLEREGVPPTTLREVASLKELNHPNIVRLFDVVITERNFFLIFEFLDRDLRKLMEETQSLTPESIKKIISQILSALVLCHTRRFMHRDLKPDNILIDSNFDIKLADFGLARSYQIPGKPYTNEVQTLWYRAPEILLGCPQYSFSIDIWSVGCIFAELIRWQPLFHESTPYNQVVEIFKLLGTPTEATWEGVSGLRNFPTGIETYPGVPLHQVFHQIDSYALDLLGKMLTLNPSKRISAKEALSHPYFTGLINN